MDIHETCPLELLLATGDDGRWSSAELSEAECDGTVWCGTGHRVGTERWLPCINGAH